MSDEDFCHLISYLIMELNGKLPNAQDFKVKLNTKLAIFNDDETTKNFHYKPDLV